jgi:hypothetical protein
MFLFCYVVQMRAVSFKLLLYDVLIYGSSYIYVVIRVTRTHRCCQIFTFHIDVASIYLVTQHKYEEPLSANSM